MGKIKGIPSSEVVWVKRLTTKGDVYYITSKEFDTSNYFIYKMDGEKAVKLGKAKSPLILEDKYVKD